MTVFEEDVKYCVSYYSNSMFECMATIPAIVSTFEYNILLPIEW